MRVLELFSGYGSQALALENLDIEFTSDISEIDKYAIQAYNQLHGDTHNWGDITKIDETKLPYYDLITYSSPCQDFSVVGLQRGGDKDSGTRSSLLWECERIIRAVKPKYLLMENVKNLVGEKHKHNFIKWLKVLESIGYKNWWKVLNAKDYGVPQNRERVFVVSILEGTEYLFPNPIKLEKRLKDILEPVVDEKYYLKCDNLIEKLKDKQCLNTIRCGGGGSTDIKHSWDIVCVASRGRENGQELELNESGCSNALTSVQKDNLVAEPNIIEEPYNLYPNSGNPQAGRVYSDYGISPTLNTMQGGQREPKILEEKYKNDRNKTVRTLLRILWKEIREKKIWEQIGRFQCFSEKEILQQGMYEKVLPEKREEQTDLFKCSHNSEKYKCIIIEDNVLRDMWLSIQSRRSSQRWGLSEQQFRKFTSYLQKLSFETAPKKEKLYYMWKTDESFMVLRETLSEIQEIRQSINIKPQESYRIRKLTARECFRLMGVKDEQFNKLHGISNSQLYKLAGNSIVVDVLMGIFKNLLISDEGTKGQLTLL